VGLASNSVRIDAAAEALAVMADGLAVTKATAPLSAASHAFLRGHDTAGGGGRLYEPMEPYEACLWAHKCIQKIQMAVKGVPLRFSRKSREAMSESGRGVLRSRRAGTQDTRKRRVLRGYKSVYVGKAVEGELIEAGPVVELFANPNDYQRWTQFVEAMVGCLFRSGSVAVVKAELTGRRPGSLHVVDGRHISPVVRTDSRGLPLLLGYTYTLPKTSRKIGLTREEIVFLYRWSPRGVLQGLSPAKPGRMAIATDYSAAMFNASALANNGEPGVTIEVPGSLTPEQRSEAIATWSQRHAGPGRAKRTAILEGGAKASSLASSFVDLQFDAGKKTTRLELCALYDVPPIIAGWVDAAGDSSAYSQNAMKQFWEGLIFTLLDDLIAGVQDVVDAIDAGAEAWFDVEDQPVVQLMRLARVETAKALFGMGVPMADVNDLLDLGLPDRRHYQVGFLPMGLTPADLLIAGEPLAPADGEANTPGDDELGQRSQESDASTVSAQPNRTGRHQAADVVARAGNAAASIIDATDRRSPNTGQPDDFAQKRAGPGAPPEQPSEAELSRLWQSQVRSWAAVANRYRTALRGLMARQQTQTLQRLRAELSNHLTPDDQNHLTPDDDNRRDRAPAITSRGVKQGDTVILRIVFDVVEANQALMVRAKAFASETAKVGLRQVFSAAGISGKPLEQAVSAAMNSPQIVGLIRAQAWRATTLINGRTRQVLQRSLAAGMEAGESINELADRVQSVFGARRGQARTIAQNAVGQVYSQSRDEGEKVAGFTHKAWIHSRGPGERRPSHIAAEKRYLAAPIGHAELFQVGTARLRFPRDYEAGAPGETINCKCLSVGRFKGQSTRAAVLAHIAAVTEDTKDHHDDADQTNSG